MVGSAVIERSFQFPYSSWSARVCASKPTLQSASGLHFAEMSIRVEYCGALEVAQPLQAAPTPLDSAR